MEYRMAQSCSGRPGFLRGRAGAADRQGPEAEWQPPTLGAVTPAMVEAHFKPVSNDLFFDWRKGRQPWRRSASSGSATWAADGRQPRQGAGTRCAPSTDRAAVDGGGGKGGTRRPPPPRRSKGADIVVTMLPAGKQVRDVYGRTAAKPARARCSSIARPSMSRARGCRARWREAGLEMLDAPVSGGVGGAEAGTLTFMVGGGEAGLRQGPADPREDGQEMVHAGAAGNGQAAKICNNMILGISMIGVCEGSRWPSGWASTRRHCSISPQSSGQCWSMTNYCPVPGPVPASPANRDYRAGFAAAMMLKDLRLAQQAAAAAGAATPSARKRPSSSTCSSTPAMAARISPASSDARWQVRWP